MKKIISVVLTLVMALACFTACGEDETVTESAYSGILTKVKLGMPLKKIVSLQPDGVELYYETDTQIWSINTDTELMEIRDLVPAENAYYYVDDSIITYNFKTVKGDDEIYLKGYMSEATCLLDRKTAEDYFTNKTVELGQKHGVEPVGTMTGTEDIDMELTYMQKYDCPSYTLVFTMKESYDTVEGVDGYYGTYFSIEVTEKEVKTETEINMDNEKSEKTEKTEKKEEKEE